MKWMLKMMKGTIKMMEEGLNVKWLIAGQGEWGMADKVDLFEV